MAYSPAPMPMVNAYFRRVDIFSLHIRKYGYFAEPAKFKKKAEGETDDVMFSDL